MNPQNESMLVAAAIKLLTSLTRLVDTVTRKIEEQKD